MLGTTPLDEWSARRKSRYLHNTIQTQETKKVHTLSEIQTRVPGSQKAAHFEIVAQSKSGENEEKRKMWNM
jgi:hypothetical protein